MINIFRLSALALLLAAPATVGAINAAAAAQSDPRLGYEAAVPAPQPQAQSAPWEERAAS